jgi:hypothetical protein
MSPKLLRIFLKSIFGKSGLTVVIELISGLSRLLSVFYLPDCKIRKNG